MSSTIVNSDADILREITNLKSKQQFANNLNLIFDDTISPIANSSNKIVYIHKTNCPNCGSLLDGDENTPYVKCASCGAKIWSEREVC